MKKLNKKGMSLLEVMVVVLLIAGLAAMAYPSYLTSVEKGKALEAIRIISNTVAAQQQYYENNGSYATSFTDLDFDISGRNVNVSGAAATTDNFSYALGESSVSATHTSGSSYTYTISGNYTEDHILCTIGTDAKNDKKICSTLGKQNTDSIYIVE
ncbi:type IV pilin protein [Candidatus Proelusimicrobium volucris]|uniref:type IV pilin protein n=1 Tax=Candidatus Proelusimicrobium volucris TaxID=3416225 RepID=UPI003D118B85